jgi:hypothetical protein
MKGGKRLSGLDLMVFKTLKKTLTFSILGFQFVPGAWVYEILSYMVILIIGKVMFKEQNKKSNFFWNSTVVLGILEMIRIMA